MKRPGKLATWTGGLEAERTRSERIKSRGATQRWLIGIRRLRFASLGMTSKRGFVFESVRLRHRFTSEPTVAGVDAPNEGRLFFTRAFETQIGE
jgi:hypothetical protein